MPNSDVLCWIAVLDNRGIFSICDKLTNLQIIPFNCTDTQIAL